MKIRSSLELAEALDGALAWRKRELAALRAIIGSGRPASEQAVLRRAAVPMLYAHWEGFAKQAATFYLELVIRQRRPYRDLADSFVALGARSRLKQVTGAGGVSAYLPVVRFLLDGLDERARFVVAGAVDTASNLTSSVLRELMQTIDLPFGPEWSSKTLLIDGSLLKTRNDVAHGAKQDVDAATYDQLHSLVVELLDQLKIGILNRAVLRAYLRASGGAHGSG